MHITRYLLNATQKTTTGLFGLAIHPNPRHHLIETYKNTLNALTKLPSNAVYRHATESLTKHRLSIAESTENIQEIENKINAGIIEEVILQAEDELKLVAKMEEWKSWEPLQDPPPEKQWEYGVAK
ncbi:ETC complex I subunit conserved region-domain-containing protein [Gigaspora margarita]|uniref:ETC complex I subunit conserved region-domain-containing protein n=2 Tax=Gigaspora margarita TaxID=4874 RepID=A0A8H3WZQ6_GIGMA|nr:ETC complex I subunit conserved region-domain-containing protein [Gigaspora margarita]